MSDKHTPESIVERMLNCEISKEDAVYAINKLIEDARNSVIGMMGETERKHFIGRIKGFYKDYGYPIKGNAEEINDYLKQALKKCGFERLENVRNTEDNRYRIERALSDLRSRRLG